MLTWIVLMPFLIVFYVLIGAVLLRVSVGISNRILGVKRDSSRSASVAHFGGAMESAVDDSNPFAPPATPSIAIDISRSATEGVPEPRFGSACVIVLAAGLLSVIAGSLIGLLGSLGKSSTLMIQFNSQVVSFGVAVLVYKTMLPTSAGRAALVYVTQAIIAILVAVVVVGVFTATYMVLGL